MLSKRRSLLNPTESRLRFKTMKPKRKRPTCNRNIARKPRIKVGSMQRELQKIRTPSKLRFAIAVLKGKALIKII